MAGWGTRVRPHSWSKPKPLVGVADRTAPDFIREKYPHTNAIVHRTTKIETRREIP